VDYFFLAMGLFIPSRTSPTPLLILKTPRCGSTWFTALLNKLEKVYIRPEIISWTTRWDERDAEERNGEITSYIIESLQHPMLQWPAGEDFFARENPVIVGSTFYPRTTSVALARIAKSVPNLQVAAMMRSNVVKHAVSYIGANILIRKCNRNQHLIGGCGLDGKIHINIKVFHMYLLQVIADDANIVKWAQELSGNLGHSVIIWYENLQETEFELASFIQWLGFDIQSLGVTTFDGACHINCTKITSDDLRQVIANYEELESWIKSTYPCLSPQFYERSPGKVQPSVSILCRGIFMNLTVDFFDERD